MATSSGARGQRDGGEARGELGQELSSVRFAAVARRVGEEARSAGVEPPAFRSPPRSPGARRSIRREVDGSATVSVALRGRPGIAVIGDMIDGIIIAGELTGLDAAQLRDRLWTAAAALLDDELQGGGDPLLARRAA